MMTERSQNILHKIDNINLKSNEILSEARKILRCKKTINNLVCLNSLYSEYKRLMTKKEFCEYCLMFDTVEPEF